MVLKNAYNIKKNCYFINLLNFSCRECVICKWNRNLIKESLEKKYMTGKDYYNVKIINDIIYNESIQIVSVFKDYLIYDDVSEFLKRYYNFSEARNRLPKIYEFYEKYSKVFPNYVVLAESKYMFKNIERKQRLIDDKQKILLNQQNKKKGTTNTSYEKNRMFNTEFIDSVLKNHNPKPDVNSSGLFKFEEYKAMSK